MRVFLRLCAALTTFTFAAVLVILAAVRLPPYVPLRPPYELLTAGSLGDDTDPSPCQ